MALCCILWTYAIMNTYINRYITTSIKRLDSLENLFRKIKITFTDNLRIKKKIMTEILALFLEYCFNLFLTKERQNTNAHIIGHIHQVSSGTIYSIAYLYDSPMFSLYIYCQIH